MKKIFKKTLSLLIVLALVFTTLPYGYADPIDETKDKDSLNEILKTKNTYTREGSASKKSNGGISKNYTVSKDAKNFNIKFTVNNEGEYNDNAVVLVLDNSDSISPETIKKGARSFVENAVSKNTKVSLVVFGTESSTIADFSNDKNVLINSINGYSHDEEGTNIQAGIKRARDLLRNSGAKNKYIVLLSDGEATHSYGLNAGYKKYQEKFENNNEFFKFFLYIISSKVPQNIMNYSSVEGNSSESMWNIDFQSVTDKEASYWFVDCNKQALAEAGYARNEGCSIYTVGYAVASNSRAEKVLKKIADSDSMYYDTNVYTIDEIYKKLASKITYKYEDVLVHDYIGEHFYLPKGTTFTTKIDGVETNDIVVYDPDKKMITWNLGNFTGKASLEFTVKLDKSAFEIYEGEFGNSIPNKISTNKSADIEFKGGKDKFDNPIVPIRKITYNSNYQNGLAETEKTFGYVNGFVIASMDSTDPNAVKIKTNEELGYEKEGYDFIGWNTKKDGSGEDISKISGIYNDFVLYAKWKRNTDKEGRLTIRTEFIGDWSNSLPRSVFVSVDKIAPPELNEPMRIIKSLGEEQIQVNPNSNASPGGSITLNLEEGIYYLEEIGVDSDTVVTYDGSDFVGFPKVIRLTKGGNVVFTITNTKKGYKPSPKLANIVEHAVRIDKDGNLLKLDGSRASSLSEAEIKKYESNNLEIKSSPYLFFAGQIEGYTYNKSFGKVTKADGTKVAVQKYDSADNPNRFSIVLKESDEGKTLHFYFTYIKNDDGNDEDDEDDDDTVPYYPEDETEDIDEDDTPLGKLNKEDHVAYIFGYPDGSVKPNGLLYREEAAAVFYRLMKDDYRKRMFKKTNVFLDVNSTRWSNDDISTLANAGIIHGYGDGTFRPYEPIKRGELAIIAANFEGLEANPNHNIVDIKGTFAEKYIASAAKRGWVKIGKDGKFRPNDNITRAEFINFVNNVLGWKVKKENILPGVKVFTDLKDDKAWYYTDLRIATNSYEFRRLLDNFQKWTRLLKIRYF